MLNILFGIDIILFLIFIIIAIFIIRLQVILYGASSVYSEQITNIKLNPINDAREGD